MTVADSVLAQLAYMEELGDGPQLVATLAYCGRWSSSQVTAALGKLCGRGLVVMVRRTRQGCLWGLAPKGRPLAAEALKLIKDKARG